MSELSMSKDKMDLEHLQEMVCTIPEVSGCRFVTGRGGAITEIHVVSNSTKDPRYVSRDVQSLLKVNADLDLDFRIISVTRSIPTNRGAANVKPMHHSVGGGAAVAAASAVPRPMEEVLVESGESPRVLFESLSVTHARSRVLAEVTLAIDERQEVGESEAADTGDGHLLAVIQATLQAMLLLFQPNLSFDIPHFKVLTFGREEVMVVYLSAIEGRDFRSYIGSAVIRQDIRQTAVLATLSALNRVASCWDERGSLDIEII